MTTTGDSSSNAAEIVGCRVLVIDDEEVVLKSLRRTLERHHHYVDLALSSSSALERLAQHDYDLVITDLMMPEMNGIELLHRMRSLNLSIPVLVITGYPSIPTALESLRLGAVDYVPKPFTRKELMTPVNRALAGKTSAADDSSRR